MAYQSPLVPVKRRRSLRLSRASHDTSLQDAETKENASQLDAALRRNVGAIKTPLTPVHNNLVHNLRQRLEQRLSEKIDRADGPAFSSPSTGESRTSPGLTTLRMTPGKKLREKQEVLVKKHEEARSKAMNASTGGGVSIWPEMDNMRLSARDVRYILVLSITLMVFVIYLFTLLHGGLLSDLRSYLHRLKTFSASHPLDTFGTQQTFDASLLHWHTSFTTLLDELTGHVEVSLSQTSVGYQAYLLLYVCGILTLLYYLVDNVVATNKLTPHRIKIWISLLVVMGTWTLLMLQLLVLAQAVEVSVETNVHWFNSQLGDLIYLTFDLVTYRDLLTYWTTRCLPPMTPGTLSVLGVMAVRDISYYLQYYSLPVLTALLMPVAKLVLALKRVYAVKPHA